MDGGTGPDLTTSRLLDGAANGPPGPSAVGHCRRPGQLDGAARGRPRPLFKVGGEGGGLVRGGHVAPTARNRVQRGLSRKASLFTCCRSSRRGTVETHLMRLGDDSGIVENFLLITFL